MLKPERDPSIEPVKGVPEWNSLTIRGLSEGVALTWFERRGVKVTREVDGTVYMDKDPIKAGQYERDLSIMLKRMRAEWPDELSVLFF